MSSQLSFYKNGDRKNISLDQLWQEEFSLKWVIGLPGLPHINLGKIERVTCEKATNYLIYSSNLFPGKLEVKVPLRRVQDDLILPIGYYLANSF